MIYELITDKVTTWRNLGRAFPPEQLQTILWEGVHSLRVVTSNTTGVCVGFVSLFHADLANQTAEFSIAIDPGASETAGGEAATLFIRHVFKTSSFRKIYAETTELSLPSLKLGISPAGSKIEGRRVGALIIAGQEHDLVTLTLDRAEFLAATDREYRFTTKDVIPRAQNRPSWSSFLDELVDHFPQVGEIDLTGGVLLLEDLGIDSLTLIEMVSWVEEHFGVAIDDDELLRIKTVQEFFDLVGSESEIATSAWDGMRA